MTDVSVVVQKAYDWNLWILPKVEKFPKSYRFSVGQNLVATSLDLLMNLVDATYQSKNSSTLAAAVRNVNRARYLVRLSKDLRLLNVSGYEFAAQGLDEIGRMAGGWWKSARTASGPNWGVSLDRARRSANAGLAHISARRLGYCIVT